MIMKITNNTRRTSISGTTFISETIPRLEPPTDMPMSHLAVYCVALRGGLHHHIPATNPVNPKKRRRGEATPVRLGTLLAGFDFGCDQTNLVDAVGAHDVDSARNAGEQYIVIALHKSDFLGAILEDLIDA